MFNGKKIIVVLPAYKAARTLERTYKEIPFDIVDDVRSVSYTQLDVYKRQTPTPTPTPKISKPTIPSFQSNDGAIIAILTRTYSSSGYVDVGTGMAYFGDLSKSVYNDAGKVSLNGNNFQKLSNNIFEFTPTAATPSGIDLSLIHI